MLKGLRQSTIFAAGIIVITTICILMYPLHKKVNEWFYGKPCLKGCECICDGEETGAIP